MTTRDYIRRRYAVIAVVAAALAVTVAVFVVSGTLVNDLAERERESMHVWADATKTLVNADDNLPPDNLDLLLRIIGGNRNIPVILTDDSGTILLQRNFGLPDTPVDSMTPRDRHALESRLASLRHGGNVIDIAISPGTMQHLYYEDSRLLRALGYYPYVMVAMMLVMAIMVYCVVVWAKRAEQNKVWVGLSKETAHQLGTPISSLMAWMELLETEGVDRNITDEMNKDVRRLATVASRFGKIGSKPTLEPADLNRVVTDTVEYMSARISPRITLNVEPCDRHVGVKLCVPLMEWVLENMIKNAVDAIDGDGRIDIALSIKNATATVRISDTGRGIAPGYRRRIFEPGFTTKQRGWGLGLTLARRIITRYHGGRLMLGDSAPGKGTTFYIELPSAPLTHE